MDSPIFRRKWSRSRMAANGLGIILFEYSDRLQGLGYSRDTIHQYTQAVEHFGFWRSQAFSRSRNVTASEVAEFLTSHLPICRCPPPASKTFRTCRAALHHLMLMVGCVSPDSSVRARLGPVTEAVARFDRYLEDVCGLGDATRLYRRRYAREFLEWRFKGKRFVTASLRLADFVRYVSHRTPALRPSSVSVMTVSLRSLVKFLEIEQECAIGLSRLWPKMPNFYRAAAGSADGARVPRFDSNSGCQVLDRTQGSGNSPNHARPGSPLLRGGATQSGGCGLARRNSCDPHEQAKEGTGAAAARPNRECHRCLPPHGSTQVGQPSVAPLSSCAGGQATQCRTEFFGWTKSGQLPRLHDLRHTFACRVLEKWEHRPAGSEDRIDWLSRYLGHESVSDTYWYLTATPALLSAAAHKFKYPKPS